MSTTPRRITVTLNDARVTADAGQSVGAVLMGQGIKAWRTTRNEGKPRGLFCGIGACYDCLVTIDGQANQRACLVEATESMTIEGDFNA
ncbi:(2Fe-2S)-binding protein [Paeniglutamicibacter sp. ABSL32-1]|uniref:(2Fe-2S)-binding protein n=1 Tax=Paeniglutamicibacter quisquiliarum TaxID=2849498 RepID=UPI001C2D3007|nr:(2Fe-2S)-binding protein [Paeniglutamicibacter quisquiliarum]MBV1777983.1 (2Fe-2S)-binding protein [Paeniglutamicibacter quisquiliarum]